MSGSVTTAKECEYGARENTGCGCVQVHGWLLAAADTAFFVAIAGFLALTKKRFVAHDGFARVALLSVLTVGGVIRQADH